MHEPKQYSRDPNGEGLRGARYSPGTSHLPTVPLRNLLFRMKMRDEAMPVFQSMKVSWMFLDDPE